MNQKLARTLRQAAGYRNQSATPGTMDFPGVARMYTHPVVMTRQAIRKCYVYMVDKWHKIETEVTAVVTDRFGKGVIAMEWCAPGTVETKWEEVQQEGGGISKRAIAWNKYGFARPRTQLVPVSKSGRLNPTEPKGIYRALKRLWRKGLLTELGRAMIEARQPKEVATA